MLLRSNSMQKKLLLVDDEVAILKALRRLFKRAGFAVQIAESGKEALALMEHEDFHVVMTDFRMPHMTGGELVAEVQARFPDTVCMILSGYADLQSVLLALNSGAVYKFLEKPWDDAALVEEVEQAYLHWEDLQKRAGLTRLGAESLALVEVDHNGMIYAINPAACQQLSIEQSSAMGHSVIQFLPLMRKEQFDLLFSLRGGHIELVDLDQERALHLRSKPACNQRWILSIEAHNRTAVLGVRQLLDRSEVISHLDSVMAAEQPSVMVAYLDLSGFRNFNDYLGYSEADRILSRVAELLVANKPLHSIIGRMGGDEFVMLAADIGDMQQGINLIRELLQPFERLIPFDGRDLHISFNAGFAIGPEDGANSEVLLQNAQAACIYAKSRGRSFYPRYHQAMNERRRDLVRLQSDLYRALECEQFSVVYQPKVCLQSGNIVGAEALLRWQHEEHGAVSPAEFIPLAESSGLIESIGEWVLASASSQSRAWHEEGLPPFLVSVNLSGRQLQMGSLVERVRFVLDNTGLDPEQLELEVTETFLMQDISQSLILLEEIKALGVRLAIDDFGTGYSSLNYLHRLPIDTLKIDRSFIVDLERSSETYDLVRNVIHMSHDLGLRVVAEGVETQVQLDMLRELACDEIQGYYFSPPVSPEAFRRLLAQQRVFDICTGRKESPVAL
ncbi:GGDEF domain-containing response regulator [Neptunomonas marina]|uniref:cyclic-guanylate-specific phosphodiesterase n=2 Tax=Neptunomonas marina TaxID=1815562 RepID=A0A437QCQ9_9GAMM|nr:GGDEF domain-containing response regulator [Neptunomonas marina]